MFDEVAASMLKKDKLMNGCNFRLLSICFKGGGFHVPILCLAKSCDRVSLEAVRHNDVSLYLLRACDTTMFLTWLFDNTKDTSSKLHLFTYSIPILRSRVSTSHIPTLVQLLHTWTIVNRLTLIQI
jgi:hypothetical protein